MNSQSRHQGAWIIAILLLFAVPVVLSTVSAVRERKCWTYVEHQQSFYRSDVPGCGGD